MIIKRNSLGFSLVEMAVVLIIMGLLIGAFVTPLTAQLDQAKVAEARRDLTEIKEALLGYAVINGYFPCPDTTNSGVENRVNSTTQCAITSGNLAWSTLGLKSQDPWGRAYQYQVDNAFTTKTYTLTTNAALRICTDSTCAITESSNVPVVVFSYGKNGGIQPPTDADEKENADLDGDFVDHSFIEGGYDDIVMWISSNVLMNRMVTVGKLP